MDKEYREVINRFFRLYRELQKSNNLRMHCNFSTYTDGTIEIWERKGSEKNCICKIVEKNDIACYEKAIGVLEMHSWGKGNTEYGKKAG